MAAAMAAWLPPPSLGAGGGGGGGPPPRAEARLGRKGPWWVRPSCGEIFRLRWGVCSFGLGLAECLFRLLREENIMLHPSTEHL